MELKEAIAAMYRTMIMGQIDHPRKEALALILSAAEKWQKTKEHPMYDIFFDDGELAIYEKSNTREILDDAEKWRAMEWYSQNWRSQIEFWMPPTPAHIKDILSAYRKAQEPQHRYTSDGERRRDEWRKAQEGK